MILLNYLYFLIITYFGVKFLFSQTLTMKNPLDKETVLSMDGPEAFWVLTFSTGLLALSAPGVIDLMAIRLLVLETLCIIGIVRFGKRPVWSVPLCIYAVYLVWIVCGCFYSSSPAFGFRVVLKYIYPFVIALFASATVSNIELFAKAGLGARTVGVVCIVCSFIPGIGYVIPGVFWYGTAKAINFISLMVFSMGLYYFSDEKKKNMCLSILFLIPCFIWVFRTSIMGSMVAIMGFYLIMYRLRSLPIIMGVLVLGVFAVFTIPSLKEKMFYDDNKSIEQFQSGKVTMNDVNTNARAAMWKHLEGKFYDNHQIVGSGTGSVQSYMYSTFIFGGLKVPHSDFVQMKCDSGIIGLILYLAALLTAFIHCLMKFHSAPDNIIKLSAIVAGASMIGVLSTLYSDNVVNYSMATLSMPFGFYGMMLGISKNDEL